MLLPNKKADNPVFTQKSSAYTHFWNHPRENLIPLKLY